MKETVEIRVVKGWEELSQDELRMVYEIKSRFEGHLDTDLVTICIALRLSGIKVAKGREYVVKVGKEYYSLTKEEVTSVCMEYAWLSKFPDTPVRLDAIGTGIALDVLMRDLTFEQYLAADNHYQGLLQGNDDTHLDYITEILYPGIGKKDRSEQATRLNTFYWWTSFKMWASRRWPHFLQPVAESSGFRVGPDTARESTDAQIRALTKGDVTKEKEIRKIACHRALTELNTLAKEAEELEKIKKS